MAALAPKEMGAGIAASPHCAERRICRCSVYLVPLLVKGLAPRFSILAHQLRRRFPSYRSLRRGARLLLDCASRRFACLSMSGLFVWPDLRFLIFRSEVLKPVARSKPSDVPRPFLGKHLLRPASLTLVPKNPGSRVALEGISSSGASSRLARFEPEGSPQSCRRRSVLLPLPRPSGRCRLSEETGTSAPIT